MDMGLPFIRFHTPKIELFSFFAEKVGFF